MSCVTGIDLERVRQSKSLLALFKGTGKPGTPDYSRPASSRLYKAGGAWVAKPLVGSGNKKLHAMWYFDLPAGGGYACRETCKGCYALKAQRQYPAVHNYRLSNLWQYLHDAKGLRARIVGQLAMGRWTQCRVHTSGEFIDQAYVEFWYGIARQFPGIRFFAYTKKLRELDFETSRPSNFNVIDSKPVVKELEAVNYGSLPYIEALAAAIRDETGEPVKLCPCGIDKSVRCGIDCTDCDKFRFVVFLQH